MSFDVSSDVAAAEIPASVTLTSTYLGHVSVEDVPNMDASGGGLMVTGYMAVAAMTRSKVMKVAARSEHVFGFTGTV